MKILWTELSETNKPKGQHVIVAGAFGVEEAWYHMDKFWVKNIHPLTEVEGVTHFFEIPEHPIAAEVRLKELLG